MTNENRLKIGIISLGCDKNRVDTELMLTFLRDAGYDFTPNPAESDIIIINTCGFISSARKESMDTIIEMSKYKKIGSCKRLVVTGCMPQLWLKEMREELPDVSSRFITLVSPRRKRMWRTMTSWVSTWNDSPAIQTPSPGAVCPAMVTYGART